MSTPDWRADRHSIRIALALRERHGVGPGDAVGISMPFVLLRAFVERAIWGLGAMSVSSEKHGHLSVDAALAGELVELGGPLDTPERATHFRALARDVPPEALASIDDGRELTQAEWADAVERFLLAHPPAAGTIRQVVGELPDVASRVALYAGWSDGLTCTAIGSFPPGFETARFVRLSSDHA